MEKAQLTQLVERARGGDLDAFDGLVREFQNTVAATAIGWLRSPEAAADVVQDTFLDVFTRLGELRDPAAFPGWMRTIVVKHCDRVTRRRAAVPLEEPLEDHDAALGPEASLIAGEDRSRLGDALEALAPAERLVTALHYLAGLSGPEIANYLDISLALVKKRLRVARARLRNHLAEESLSMMQHHLRQLRPSLDERIAASVQVFLAVRAGDIERLDHLLDLWPDLVGAHEDWTFDEAIRLDIPIATAGTPLLRAIERGRAKVVSLLLARGANPNGACGCPGGEAPLWTAVAHDRASIARALLAAGADPNRAAFRGQRPLHVAASRGHGHLVDLLLGHRARTDLVDAEGRTPLDWAELNGHSSIVARLADVASAPFGPSRSAHRRADRWETGIRAIDLLCPLPLRGLVRCEPAFGVGATVLLVEISARLAPAVGGIIWAGIEPRPVDHDDVAHAIRELDSASDIEVRVASRSDGREVQRARLRHAISAARDLAGRDGALLVLLTDHGFQAEIDRVLPELEGDDTGQLTTIVVGPLVDAVPSPCLERPYTSLIAFDRARAAAGEWPALDLMRCDTRLPLSDGHRRILAETRRLSMSDDGTAREIGRYLAQPFYTTEPFSSLPGEWTPLDRTQCDLQRIADHGSSSTGGAVWTRA